jgi:2-methylisocitrate lyase-like PEP mutase family enzyme
VKKEKCRRSVVVVSSASVLRSLLAGTAEKPLVFPGVGTPLEALSAEAAGFAAVYLSGYAVAAWRHGLPDIGLLGARDTAEALTAITRVTSVPVIVDADTGYGDAASVHSTVRLLEAAGAAAIQFEDQAWPKKCGHMSDKEVIDADDAVRKIEAAVAARTNPDTVIIARTDAIGPSASMRPSDGPACTGTREPTRSSSTRRSRSSNWSRSGRSWRACSSST